MVLFRILEVPIKVDWLDSTGKRPRRKNLRGELVTYIKRSVGKTGIESHFPDREKQEKGAMRGIPWYRAPRITMTGVIPVLRGTN